MIIVKIILHVNPKKQLEFRQTLVSMVEVTRRESGCLYFTGFYDILDENHFNLLEKWETRADWHRHTETKRFKVLLGLKTLLSEAIKIDIYSVSTPEGVETVELQDFN